MTRLLFANTDQIIALMSLQSLCRSLPDSFLKKALRYHQKQDAYNFILGRLLLQKAYALLFNAAILDWDLLYFNASGKPLLNDCFFSISHSNNIVAIAFNPTVQVGLDVEFSQQLNKKHFKHCFDANEWKRIQLDESMHTFFLYWTQKEAILKTLGLALNALEDIQVQDSSTAAYQPIHQATTPVFTKALPFAIPKLYACLGSTEVSGLLYNTIEDLTEQFLV